MTILDALRDRLGDQVEIVHEPGADTVRSLPVLGGGGDDGAQLVAPDGSDGLALDVFAGPDFAGEPVERQARPTGELFCFGPPSPAAGREFSARLTGTITARAQRSVAAVDGPVRRGPTAGRRCRRASTG